MHASITGTLDSAALAKIVGYGGDQNGAVYKITIGRPDIPLKEMGASINSRMGLNTRAAFYGSDGDAVIAIHHMTGTNPPVIFLHYWGTDSAQKLASAFRAALDQTGARPHATAAHRSCPATRR